MIWSVMSFWQAILMVITGLALSCPWRDQPALASDEARFKGEAVALIAGHSQDLASQDMSDFPITWTEQQPLMDVELP